MYSVNFLIFIFDLAIFAHIYLSCILCLQKIKAGVNLDLCKILGGDQMGYFRKRKSIVILVGLILVSAIIVFALDLPTHSDDWHCYTDTNGACICDVNSSGGTGSCVGSNPPQNTLFYATSLPTEIANDTRCQAFMTCPSGYDSVLCTGTYHCRADPNEDSGEIWCNTNQYSC